MAREVTRPAGRLGPPDAPAARARTVEPGNADVPAVAPGTMRPGTEREQLVRPQERDIAAFHAAFLVIAAAALTLRGDVDHGIVLLTLVVVYHLGSVGLASSMGHTGWLRWWGFGAVLSLLMVLPDAVLVEGLGVLRFPPDGVPDLGPVTLHMAGLWTIPVVLIVATAEAVAHRRGDAAAAVTAVLAAAVVFGVAEATLTRLPVWEPVGVTTFGGVAAYILPAELLLGLLVFAAARWTRTGSVAVLVPVAVLVALAYTGAACVSWLVIERGLLA